MSNTDNIFNTFIDTVSAVGNFLESYITTINIIWIFGIALGVWIGIKIIHHVFIYFYRAFRSIEKVLFRVSIPKESGVGTQGIALAEQLYNSLQGIYKLSPKTVLISQEHFTYEISYIDDEITFYFSIPRKYSSSVKKQINSFYPDAFVEEVPDYNIFHPNCKIAGACYELENGNAYSFKTYLKQDHDPLNEITNAFDQMGKDEGAVIQICARPVSAGWRREGVKILKRINKGRGLPKHGRFITAIQDFVKLFIELFKQMPPEEVSEEDFAAVSSVKSKIEKDAFEVSLRIITASATKEQAKKRLMAIEDTLNQFDLPGVNRMKPGRIWFKRRLIANYIFRHFPIFGETMVLNTEELATLAHFPNTAIDTPNIHWLASKTAPAPENIPKEGALMGVNVYRGQKKQVHILPVDRRRHTYIVGKTGMGKSTMVENMALSDIYNGCGVGIIDPHGDLIENIIKKIPKSRVKDVILFDPADFEYPLGMNLLEYNTPEQKNFVVNETINIFYKLFYQFVGPKFDHYMRNAILTLMADQDHQATLIDIPRIFSSESFARAKAKHLTNPVARAFWTDEMAVMTDEEKSKQLGPVIEKIEGFAADDVTRIIVGQERSSFDIGEAMRKKKILLVNLSKGNIGELNSALLGMIFVSKFHIATMERSKFPEEERKDFYLYIDEFQNFSTKSIATIFSEARKYRVNIIVSHQYIGQLNQAIAKAVFGNVGSIISFRIGAQDAAFLGPEFAPEFKPFDIVNLPKYNCYAKLMIKGRATPAFSMTTLAPSLYENSKIAAYIKEISRYEYGSPRELVDKSINDRYNISE